MSRYIDADALKSTMLNTPVKAVEGVDFNAEWFTRIANTAMQFTDMVEGAPTVDAVPVVKCGECKYLTEITDYNGWCPRINDHIENFDWFCADGERKDGEHEAKTTDD